MTPQDAKTLIENFVSGTLANRSDKSWIPRLFASADIAELCPTIGGESVEADPDLQGAIEIRLSVDDFTRMRVESPLHVTSNVAAKLEGIRINNLAP
ncbi:hypothetical protein KMZ68_13795 [Bradyrhizobium sediminis]|uniref:Uncharacterized protein n=1 Tax=Bradyrhizobium sediminis TaxID=2840469 RepID=A0A975NJA1_9BRAD|nr:hypothetical protein [Bradyrhizobium sediminis]QWG16117.1 hypothetical protein KMZ68_13795 [Bradyrhizobium sediminis]